MPAKPTVKTSKRCAELKIALPFITKFEISPKNMGVEGLIPTLMPPLQRG